MNNLYQFYHSITMIGEALLLIAAGIILFGGLKRMVGQLGVRDFVLMFLILLVVFGNLFNPVTINNFFSIALGSAVLIILSVIWLIRNMRFTGRYIPIITVAVITIVSFVYQFVLVNNTEINIYLAMFVAVIGISAVALVMSSNAVEIFTTCVIGSLLGISIADAIAGTGVVLGGNLMFTVMISSAFISVAVFYMVTRLKRVTRRRYNVRFEAAEQVEEEQKEKDQQQEPKEK